MFKTKKKLQIGGHNGPYSLNDNGTRCKKSEKWDYENCIISDKGTCRKKVKTKAVKVKDKKTQKAAPCFPPTAIQSTVMYEIQRRSP